MNPNSLWEWFFAIPVAAATYWLLIVVQKSIASNSSLECLNPFEEGERVAAFYSDSLKTFASSLTTLKFSLSDVAESFAWNDVQALNAVDFWSNTSKIVVVGDNEYVLKKKYSEYISSGASAR